MTITVSAIGSRQFINFGELMSIPVDRIKLFDFMSPNGGASRSVKIVTDDPSEDIVFANGNCDAVKEFVMRDVAR